MRPRSMYYYEERGSIPTLAESYYELWFMHSRKCLLMLVHWSAFLGAGGYSCGYAKAFYLRQKWLVKWVMG